MNLKNILTTLLLICCFQGMFSQSLQSAHHLELKKSTNYHQIMPAPKANARGLIVFATDKTSVTALRYTSVLYYTDSLTTDRPDIYEYDQIVGYSYNAEGQPSVYWAGVDHKKIQETYFDFEAKTVTDYFYELPLKDEEVLIIFSENNSFFIVTLPKLGSKLKLYIFNQGKYVQRTLDFSKFSFTDAGNKAISFNKLLDSYPLQKIEQDSYTPLPDTAGKLKFYVTAGTIAFTFSHNPAFTQLFTIDTATYAITEKIIPQTALKDAKTNAFLHNGNLYQVALNRDEIALSRTNIDSVQDTKTLKAGAEETIGFKNSPLLEQSNNRQNEFKNTKKFLRRANGGDAAVSVYQTPNDLLVVAGAVRYVVPAENVVMGVAAMAAAGIDPSEIFPQDIQTIYFESLFNDDFNIKDVPQQRLAADYIGQYLAQNERNISLQSIFKYDYYYVLAYYDARAKKYILVRFEDDFVR